MLEYYSAYLKDTDELKKVASGGVATALAHQMLDCGGVVYGATFTKDYRGVEYIKIDSIPKLSKIQGSKYSKALLKMESGESLFGDVVKSLEKQDVLFIGLPCEVAAVKKAVNRVDVPYQLYTVDLICQGPTFSSVQEQFVNELEHEYDAPLMAMSYRYKKDGWENSCFYAEFSNGKKCIMPLGQTSFWKCFCILKPLSCFNCHFKGDNHPADITTGDYWGISHEECSYNKWGTSVVVVHTKQGKKMLSDNVYLNIGLADSRNALRKNPMYYESVSKHKDYNKFLLCFNKKGITYALKHGYSLRTKISRALVKVRNIARHKSS